MLDSIKLLINDVYYDLTNLFAYPNSYQDDISKILDTYSFAIPVCKSDSVSGLDLSEPIRPQTRVEVTINNNIRRYEVREDHADTISYGSPSLYSHKISLIEHTALTERRIVPNFTVTQPKGSVNYAISQLNIESDKYLTANDTEYFLDLVNTTTPNEPTIIYENVLKQSGKLYTITTSLHLNVSGTISLSPETFNFIVRIYINGILKKTETPSIDNPLYQELDRIFTYSLTYTSSIINEEVFISVEVNGQIAWVSDARTIISSKLETSEVPITYIDDVIDKSISIQKIGDMNDSTHEEEFTLEDNTRNALNHIVAAETTYNSYTEWGVLEDQADLVKAIPRLSKNVWNEISFDFINELNKNTWTNQYETQEKKSLTLDKYIDSIEINADNVIESVESASIKVEPYEDGWLTLRSNSEGPNQLTTDSIALKLRSENYIVKQILTKGWTVTYVGGTIDTSTKVWDISEHVVHEDRWGSLLNRAFNETRSILMLGKGNTLYYKENDRRIFNFGYKAPRTSASELKKPEQAIYEIIAAVAERETGKEVSYVNSVIKDFNELLQTQYRVYLAPYNSIRVKLYKHNAREFEISSTLFANETARINDSIKLGEYGQSLVNRSGNKTRIVSGLTKSYPQVPQIGNIVGEKEIVTNVNCTITNGLYEYSATLYYDYSAINDFVGINSAHRQYEVPKEAIQRHNIYEDSITVSRVLNNQSHSIITSDGWLNLIKPFTNEVSIPITYCKFSTRHEEREPGNIAWEYDDGIDLEGGDTFPSGPSDFDLFFYTGDNYIYEYDTLEQWVRTSGPYDREAQSNPTQNHQYYSLIEQKLYTANVSIDSWEVFDNESDNPVDVYSLGCTMLVMMIVKDNYSIDNNIDNAVNEYDEDKVYQNNYNYTDVYGRVDSARYEFYTKGYTNNSVTDGNIYPEYSQAPSGDLVSKIDIRLLKDAREAIQYGHQLNFFSGLNNGVEDLRVYNGIAKFNGWALQETDADIVPVLLIGDYFPSVEETIIKASSYVETSFNSVSSVANAEGDYAYTDYEFNIITGYIYGGYALIDKTTQELIYAVKETFIIQPTYTDRIYYYPDKTKGL